MEFKKQDKPRRHKKRKSRTQVSSDSDSDSEIEAAASTSPQPQPENKTTSTTVVEKKPSKLDEDAEISVAFTKFYMQRATVEFAEDLDRVRGAEDFKDEALSILVSALQQGTEVFSREEQRRIVMAGKKVEG
ncbi:hypothetical protein HYALB_00007425 [Hymenoscyphus albidus]|uniref:Ribosome assembly protein 3 n=1 Tax=Hymenoscyphus albidus TaxID=595503 RepID=A0A9N9LX97_9HELO|nr:hypothetical protein HYALB_00007425 [Hymenoscyphus albidus]